MCYNKNMNQEIINILSEVEQGKAIILDVRRQDEWQSGHIDGAVHLDLEKIQNGELPDVNKKVIIYTYCRSGNRANQAGDILQKNEFENIVCIGGYDDWKEAGGPVLE
jgi:rhodanese-related sulfurtransferase